MLFIMSLATAGVIDAHSALVMVLGANLGSALNPLLEATGGDPVKLRVPFGNLAMRVLGCLVALPLIDPILSAMSVFDPNPARLAANFHTLFNVVVAAIFILPLPWIAKLLLKLFPEKLRASDPGMPQYLDKDALDTPSVALSNAAREVLRMVDTVEIHAAQLAGSLPRGRYQPGRSGQPHGRRAGPALQRDPPLSELHQP